MKKILFLALAGLVLASCATDDAIYRPTDNSDLSFASSTASFEIVKDEKIVVKLNRGVAKEAVSVPITLVDDNNVFTLDNASVSFDVNEYQKDITLSYDITDFTPGVEYDFTLTYPAGLIGPTGACEFSGTAMLPFNYKPYCEASYDTSYCFDANAQGYDSDTAPALADLVGTPVSLDRAEYTTKYFRLNCYNGLELEFTYDCTEASPAAVVNLNNSQFVGKLLSSSSIQFCFRNVINGTTYDWDFRSFTLYTNKKAPAGSYHPTTGDYFSISAWVVKNKSTVLFNGYNMYDYIFLDDLVTP